jgi:hypothetical protein
MVNHGSARQSEGPRLIGHVIVERKIVLAKYENATFNLMTSFYLDESNTQHECQKLIAVIDEVVPMAKKQWGYE